MTFGIGIADIDLGCNVARDEVIASQQLQINDLLWRVAEVERDYVEDGQLLYNPFAECDEDSLILVQRIDPTVLGFLGCGCGGF